MRCEPEPVTQAKVPRGAPQVFSSQRAATTPFLPTAYTSSGPKPHTEYMVVPLGASVPSLVQLLPSPEMRAASPPASVPTAYKSEVASPQIALMVAPARLSGSGCRSQTVPSVMSLMLSITNLPGPSSGSTCKPLTVPVHPSASRRSAEYVYQFPRLSGGKSQNVTPFWPLFHFTRPRVGGA